jgi:hypothetical protein
MLIFMCARASWRGSYVHIIYKYRLYRSGGWMLSCWFREETIVILYSLLGEYLLIYYIIYTSIFVLTWPVKFALGEVIFHFCAYIIMHLLNVNS